MINLLKNELTILIHRKKYKIFLIILLAITIISTFLLNTNRLLHATKNFNFINYIINISFANILILCFSIILTSEIFGLEYNNGTLKNLLVTPNKKTTIFISKIFTVLIYILIQYIILLIFSILLNLLFEKTPFNFSYILGVFINRNLLAIIISVALSTFLINYTKSISIAAITPIILYFIGSELSYSIFSSIRSYFLYSYVNVPIESNQYLHVIILSSIYVIILFALSLIKFINFEI